MKSSSPTADSAIATNMVTRLQEPAKGAFYLIPYHASGDKPKYGTRICQFQERKYLGCSLHGELMAYAYCFKLNPEDDFASVRVNVRCDDETDKQDILKALYAKIKKYGASI